MLYSFTHMVTVGVKGLKGTVNPFVSMHTGERRWYHVTIKQVLHACTYVTYTDTP